MTVLGQTLLYYLTPTLLYYVKFLLLSSNNLDSFVFLLLNLQPLRDLPLVKPQRLSGFELCQDDLHEPSASDHPYKERSESRNIIIRFH